MSTSSIPPGVHHINHYVNIHLTSVVHRLGHHVYTVLTKPPAQPPQARYGFRDMVKDTMLRQELEGVDVPKGRHVIAYDDI